jgi:serine/threonine protein kinase
LLSEEGIPKLVDFGFSERYELRGLHAFESQLAYGTPEYLCPERAKGNVHDTRKSDVWSLAITFFEILTGRTPFEREGEKFSTKEELETYWKRTVSGRWLDMKRERSSGRVSPALEALLKRMLAPNARIRLTAAEVCRDSYWTIPPCMCILSVIFYTLIINVHISRPVFAGTGAFQATVLHILGTLEQVGCHRKVQNTLAGTPWRQ